MRSAAPGWRRWSWRRPAKPRPGVKAPSMGAFHRPVRFHGRPRRRRPPSGSPSKCSALALHLHGKPPARCRRRPGRTASVWQCAACAERGTSTRPCRLASAGAALRPPPCSDHRAGSYCQETRVSVWSSSKYRRTRITTGPFRPYSSWGETAPVSRLKRCLRRPLYAGEAFMRGPAPSLRSLLKLAGLV